MNTFHLEIVTPDGLLFSGNAESLLVRTTEGDAEILAGHADYLATLDTGRARIRTEGEDRFAAISGGFVTVGKEDVSLVATTFEFADMIDIGRAKAAKERAEGAIKRAKNKREANIAEAKLKRAVSRIAVASQK